MNELCATSFLADVVKRKLPLLGNLDSATHLIQLLTFTAFQPACYPQAVTGEFEIEAGVHPVQC